MSTSSESQKSQNAFEVAGLRRRVLTLTGFYLPGFRAGGPIRSLRNLHHHLGDQIQFDVITSDRDLGDQIPYPSIQAAQWNTVEGQQVFYFRPGIKGLIDITRALRTTSYDSLYLNSFFSVKTTTFTLLLRWLKIIPQSSVILAPRGEFSKGALGLKSAKKKVFIRLLRYSPLLNNIIWQATNPDEAEAIQQTVGNVRVVTAHNLSVPPLSRTRSARSQGDPLRVVFVSRINRMKNLDYALRVLANVNCPIHFTIAGPQEDQAYWAECTALVAALPQQITVTIMGSIPPDDVGDLLVNQDVLLLPTLGENYGHVIVEALLNGCIPVISDQTPWNDMNERKIGYTIELLNFNQFVSAINELSSIDLDSLQKISNRAMAYGYEIASTEESIAHYECLFCTTEDLQKNKISKMYE